MRILTVTHFYEDHGGGIERVAANLCRQFAIDDAVPLWAASAQDLLPAGETAHAIPLRCFNFVERLTGLPMPIPSPGALLRLRRAVADSDAVIVHDALYLTSIAALVLARVAHRPVVLIQHIADIPLRGRVLPGIIALANRLVTRPMIAAADHVIFISETTRAAFAGVPTRHVPILAFNGVDSSIFYPDAIAARDAPPRDLLFVGRFVEKKGLAVIEALARHHPDWRFTLAGHGPIDPDRWDLANVRVVRGASGVSLAALYRAADCLLLPSVGEGYPLVVQEAMACGLPVVCGADTARADPGASQWLRGVEIDLKDVPATVMRLSASLAAPLLSNVACQAMAAYAQQTYSWKTMADAVRRCFRLG